jgi:8-amino-7-oxononanoate synthase
MYQAYQKYLANLHNTGKYRQLPELPTAKKYLNFTTNDYLNLSHHKHVMQAAKSAMEKYGVGSGGSRLLSGNSQLFENFETQIAQDKNTQAALIFSSGFQANISVLATLLDAKVWQAKPIVFFDKLNHSSLYQAVFLSAAELQRYNHNDIDHLSKLLAKFANDLRPKFIITETIFGMDGDILPIEKVAALAAEHRAFLYLDEAHSTGILGPNGYGLSTSTDLKNISAIIMGTFSKAIGCSGGYIACDQILKDYLINKAYGFIYSTAPSPMCIGAASKAWEMLKELEPQRKKLHKLSMLLRTSLKDLKMNIGLSNSHIVPIIVGEEKQAIALKDRLLENKILVSCIRPPTVPPGTSRLRIALNSTHSKSDIYKLLEVLQKVI